MSVYVGIDVHRKRSQVAVVDAGGEVLANRRSSILALKAIRFASYSGSWLTDMTSRGPPASPAASQKGERGPARGELRDGAQDCNDGVDVKAQGT